MESLKNKSAFYKAGYAIADAVFAPDYHEGEWYVYFRGTRKKCANRTTAKAWANYLMRQYGSWAVNDIATGKVF